MRQGHAALTVYHRIARVGVRVVVHHAVLHRQRCVRRGIDRRARHRRVVLQDAVAQSEVGIAQHQHARALLQGGRARRVAADDVEAVQRGLCARLHGDHVVQAVLQTGAAVVAVELRTVVQGVALRRRAVVRAVVAAAQGEGVAARHGLDAHRGRLGILVGISVARPEVALEDADFKAADVVHGNHRRIAHAVYAVYIARAWKAGKVGNGIVERAVGRGPGRAVVARLGAVGIDEDHERVAVVRVQLQQRHDGGARHVVGPHGRLLGEEAARQVYFGCQHHLAGQLTQRHTARPEAAALDGLPIVGGQAVAPVALHAEVVLQVEARRRFGEARADGAVGGGCVVVGERQGLLLQDVVPDGVVHARDGVVHEAHGGVRGVAGIHGDVGRRRRVGAHAVVPDDVVDGQRVLVHVEAARLRGVGVGGIGGGDALVGHDGVLRQHAALRAVDGTVARGRVVGHHAGGQHEVLRVVVLARRGVVGVGQVDRRAVAGRVVGQHGAVHQAAVVHVDGTARAVGIVVAEQAALHAALAQVDTAAVGGGVVLGDDAAAEVGVGPVHVDTRAAVGDEALGHARSALGVAAAYGHAVQRGDVGEGRVLAGHGGEPDDVARVARQRPAVVLPQQVGRVVVGGLQDGLVRVVPGHRAAPALALRVLRARKAAVDADAVPHAERGRVARAGDELL